MMKTNEERKNAVDFLKRIIKRLPEIIIIALLVFTGLRLWMENDTARFASVFALRSSHGLESIPLFHKLTFTIPALLLVFFFAEDIFKVSILNRVEEAGDLQNDDCWQDY